MCVWIFSTRPTSSNFTKSRKEEQSGKESSKIPVVVFFSLTSALFKKTLGLVEKCPSLKIVSLRKSTELERDARKQFESK